MFHVCEDVYVNNRIHPKKLNALSRLGYSWYSNYSNGLFEIKRPTKSCIGFDEIPEILRKSNELTAKELSQLASVNKRFNKFNNELINLDLLELIHKIKEYLSKKSIDEAWVVVNEIEEAKFLKMQLWQPTETHVESAEMTSFINFVNDKTSLNLKNYDELYAWSISDSKDFWASCWEYFDILYSSPYSEVCNEIKQMPGATWFKGAKLNFAENLLRHRNGNIAIKFFGENKVYRELSYSELYLMR